MLGTVIGSYRLTDSIGHGSMGDVFLGEHLLFPRRAAIKCVRADRAGNPDSVERMIREATAASAVDHPSIVTVYEAGRLPDGGIFLALEYVDGETLAGRLARGPLSIAEAVSLGRQVAEGLAELHSRGVLHRDLKPANLMLTVKGRVKILDFGVAQLRTADRLTRTGVVVGTPAFMSPEQVRGEPLDGRSDLFSLGGVLYHALSGRLPFEGGGFEAVMLKILHDPPPDLLELRPDLPEGLVQFIECLLEKDPARRSPDAQEAADRFADWERMALPADGQPDPGETPAAAQATGAQWQMDAGSQPDPRMVIVYPFENVGASPERTYFGEGLAEALTTALSQHRQFKVVAAAAVRALNRKGTTPLDAARRLGAGRVCLGTARWVGDRVRVTGQLLSAPDGAVLWSRQEDGGEEAFFGIQDQLSGGLLDALKEQFDDSGEFERFPDHLDTLDASLAGRVREPIPAQALRVFQRGVVFLDDSSRFALRRAEESFRECLTLAPRFTPARAHLAMALLKRFLRFERRPELLREAFTEANRSEQEDARSARAASVLALCLAFQGDYAGARERAERAGRLDPNLAFAHLVRAHAAGFVGDLETAHQASVDAVLRDPLDPFILHFAALTLSEVAGEEMRAVEWLRRACSLAPDHFGSMVKLGEMYTLVMRSEEARRAYEDALGSMPAGQEEAYGHAYPMAWDGLALALIGLGRYSEAKGAAESALRAGGEGAPVVAHKNLAWAWRGLGRVAEARAAAAQAESQARAYLEMNPSDFQYWTGLGEILCAAGDCIGAESAARRAVEINAASHMVLGTLARVLAVQGKDEALALTASCLERAPESAAVAFDHFTALDLLGRKEEADSALHRARGLGFAADGWIAIHRALRDATRG